MGGMGSSQGKPHRTYFGDWYREARNAKTKSGRHGRSSSTASEHSLSPMPGYDNVRTRKHSAVEATENAARSIAERNNHLTESDEFDRLMELKKMRDKKALKIEKCRL